MWHVPAAEPVTVRQFAGLLGLALGRDLRVRRIPAPATRLAAIFTPIVRELPEVAYQFEGRFVVDGSKFSRRFPAFAPTPHAEALAAARDWFAGADQAAVLHEAAA